MHHQRRAALLTLLLSACGLPGLAWADCTADDQCKHGRLCIDGQCASPATCQVDVDCTGDLICVAGACTAAAAPAAPIEAPADGSADAAQMAPTDVSAAEETPSSIFPNNEPGAPLYKAMVEEHASRGLVHAGAWPFLAVYLSTIILTSIAGDEEQTVMAAVPFIGPFVLMESADSDARGALLASGMIQVAGLALMIAGGTSDSGRTWVPADGDTASGDYLVTPTVTPGGAGLGVLGRF